MIYDTVRHRLSSEARVNGWHRETSGMGHRIDVHSRGVDSLTLVFGAGNDELLVAGVNGSTLDVSDVERVTRQLERIMRSQR